MQQDLKNTTAKELGKQGIPVFSCQASESSEAESQGKAEEKNKRSSSKEDPRSNTSCKWGVGQDTFTQKSEFQLGRYKLFL